MSTTDEDNNPNEIIDECGKKRYRSKKYHEKILAEQNQLKKDHQTMGLISYGQPQPENYLKQKPHDVWPPHKCTEFKREHKLPPIPKPIKQSDLPQQQQTDFIRRNICAVTNPDCGNGDGNVTDEKIGCGCEKCKEAAVAAAAVEQKPVVRRQRSNLTSSRSMCCSSSASMFVKDNENRSNLNVLKSKRDSLMREFLGLPLLTDTITRIMRKSRLERLLDDYEKQIAKIEYQ